MKRVVVLLLGVVACSGGGAGTAPPHGPVELVIPPIASAAGATHKAASKGGTCSVGLSTGPVQMSSPSCYLDQHVENGGVLTYPCSGEDGEVTAAFEGKLEYAGYMRGGELELEKRTELDWDGDSCRWGTIGTIRGTLLAGAGGELTKQQLQWTYADRVISGTNCSGACRATATFNVSEHELSTGAP